MFSAWTPGLPVTGLWSAVSGFPFSITLPILAQISSSAHSFSCTHWVSPGAHPVLSGWGRTADAREGVGWECSPPPCTCFLSPGPSPAPTYGASSCSLLCLIFRTPQESLSSWELCVCMRAWQNSCVDVLGGEACRLSHAVRSTGQLKFYFHEVTLKQEVGFQKCSLLTEWGWWETLMALWS